MKNKIAVAKLLENLDINVTLIENMFSRQYPVQDYIEQVRRLKEKILQLKGLVERESDEFA